MSCRGVCPSRLLFSFFFAVLALLFDGSFGGGLADSAFGQEDGRKGAPSASPARGEPRAGDRPYLRDRLEWNWNQRGRTVPAGDSAAGLRFRAYRQKMAMRSARLTAASVTSFLAGPPKRSLDGAPPSAASSAVWVAVGPAPLASDATGDGMQDYNWVSGRATSVLIDPSDTSANTVLLGGAYGGLWKSTNAGSQSSNPGLVTWQALIDDQPTLAVGAMALQPGNSNVLLVGTGETNNSGDSYYGLGILRSPDGGSTWTQIQGAETGESFLGIGFSKIAFSTANPSLVVAATAGDNGLYVGLEEDGNSTARGLYFSQDGGMTWNRAILADGAVPASATAVIYNPSQGASGTFYAFIRRHGLYSSTDGQNFTRLAAQPGAGLAAGLCPAGSNATSCLIYRGEFAVVPGRNEMYAWVVDVQTDNDGNPAGVDEGIWQSTDGGASWILIPDHGIANCGDNAFGANSGCGVEQGWYNLELAAIPNAAGTDVYAGAINLYKCTLQGGTTCTQGDWINLTHVYGCNPGPLAAPAHVHPDQHGLAFMVASGKAVGYFAHDGGISRTLDGYAGLNTGSCTGTNQFDSLSETLGSMTEFVSVSVEPTDADIMFGGTQDNGSPKTGSATSNSTWQNALGGDGGFNAINPANTNEWFAANPYVTIVKCEFGTACNDTNFFQVVSSSNLGGDQGAFYTPYILDPQNPNELLVGTCRVWRISSSGSGPLQLSNDFDTLGTGACTGGEINMVNGLAAGGPAQGGYSTVVYAVTNGYGPLSGLPGGEVWATTNAGISLMENVTRNVNPNGYAISTVAMDRTDASGGTAYVGIMGFSTRAHPASHVWKTANAAASWTDWTGAGMTELPDAPVNALLVDAQTGFIYAGTDVGVFVSSTSAPSWTEVGPAPGPGVLGFLPNAPVTALQMFNPDAGTKTLVASTYGRGIWNYALVASPDYTNVILNSTQTVFPAQSATFNGTLTARNGYANGVNLSCTGAAPSTCTPSTPVTPTSTYTVTAGGGAGDYSFNVHAVGTDENAITRDVAVMLHVVDFNLSAPNPNSLTVGRSGTSAASTLQVTAAGSFAGTVTLGCPTGLPTGAACVFSPSGTVSPTASEPVTVTLTVTAAAGTPVGAAVVTISAMAAGAPSAKTQTFALTVTAPPADFTIAVTAAPNTTAVNQNVTWNGTLTAINGYGGIVTLACTGGYPGTCGIAPLTMTPTAGGAGFRVTLGSATAAAFNFAIQGTDGTLTRVTATSTLTVGTDVTWTDAGSGTATVLAGQSANYTFLAVPSGGAVFTAAVSFRCSGLPLLTNGNLPPQCVFNPTTIAAGTGTTAVTVTIPTAGPNSGAQSRHSVTPVPRAASPPAGGRRYARSGPGILPFFTLAWVLVAGIAATGGKRCGKRGLCGGVFLAVGLMAELSCGGVAGSGSTGPPITVTVSAGVPSSLFPSHPGWPAQTAQFTAAVINSSNTAVTWAVGGGSANGSIDANGLYTAPAAVAGLPGTATISAISQADTTKSGSSPETLNAVTVPAIYSNIMVTATENGAAHSDAVTLIVQ
jgi:hypothetical protein